MTIAGAVFGWNNLWFIIAVLFDWLKESVSKLSTNKITESIVFCHYLLTYLLSYVFYSVQSNRFSNAPWRHLQEQSSLSIDCHYKILFAWKKVVRSRETHICFRFCCCQTVGESIRRDGRHKFCMCWPRTISIIKIGTFRGTCVYCAILIGIIWCILEPLSCTMKWTYPEQEQNIILSIVYDSKCWQKCLHSDS